MVKLTPLMVTVEPPLNVPVTASMGVPSSLSMSDSDWPGLEVTMPEVVSAAPPSVTVPFTTNWSKSVPAVVEPFTSIASVSLLSSVRLPLMVTLPGLLPGASVTALPAVLTAPT